MDKTLQTEMREYAWRYFSLHADQRLKTFRFYVVLSTVIVGGILTMLKEPANLLLASPLSFILTFISLIFWKLDVRNKQLIKHAEDALKYIENQTVLSNEGDLSYLLNLFSHEEMKTNEATRFSSISLFDSHFSYSNCFNAIFLVFGVIGFCSGIILVVLGNV